MPHWIKTTCTRCGACLPECPTGSIFQGRTTFVIDTDTCLDHKQCVSVCPVDAIHPYPRDPKTGALAPETIPEKEFENPDGKN